MERAGNVSFSSLLYFLVRSCLLITQISLVQCFLLYPLFSPNLFLTITPPSPFYAQQKQIGTIIIIILQNKKQIPEKFFENGK